MVQPEFMLYLFWITPSGFISGVIYFTTSYKLSPSGQTSSLAERIRQPLRKRQISIRLKFTTAEKTDCTGQVVHK